MRVKVNCGKTRVEVIMKYRIISVGKIKEIFYLEGIKEYLKRLSAYANIELVDGLEERINPRAGQSEIYKVLQKEADKISALLGKDEMLIVLDLNGKTLDSEQFAKYVNAWNNSGKNRINLVVGGSYGLYEQIKKQADLAISFSSMTFPHQMAVLILSEQLYRSFKIIRGEPYHK